MRRYAACVAMMAAIGFFALASPVAIASEVVVSISGRFGEFDYGNQPAPLNDGYFSGTVTFASLPTAGNTVISSTADVNFYNSSHTLLFTIGNGGYDTITAGAHGYTYLSVGGIVNLGNGTSVDVAPLSLEFRHWDFGSPFGIVKPYGPPNYDSTVEYTYFPTGGNPEICGTTYYDPVCRGFVCATSVPEPASIVLGIVGFAGALVYSRSYRRKATA
jgi:hypothetical protein